MSQFTKLLRYELKVFTSDACVSLWEWICCFNNITVRLLEDIGGHKIKDALVGFMLTFVRYVLRRCRILVAVEALLVSPPVRM